MADARPVSFTRGAYHQYLPVARSFGVFEEPDAGSSRATDRATSRAASGMPSPTMKISMSFTVCANALATEWRSVGPWSCVGMRTVAFTAAWSWGPCLPSLSAA